MSSSTGSLRRSAGGVSEGDAVSLRGLLPVLLIFFVSAGWLAYRSFQESRGSVETTESSRVVADYVTSGVAPPDFDNQLSLEQLTLTRQFWDSLQVMDRHLVKGDIEAAMAIRRRLDQVAERTAQLLNVGGYQELISHHADVVPDGQQAVLLDPDAGRAQRRLDASAYLEHVWWNEPQGDDVTFLPELPLAQYQSVEVARALRRNRVLLTESPKTPSALTVSEAGALLKWSQDHPAAVVKAERALLALTCWNYGYVTEKTGITAASILDELIGAVTAQAPQRNELLEQVIRLSTLVEGADETWRLNACHYVLSLGREAPPKLWKLAVLSLERMNHGDQARAAIDLHLEADSSPLQGVAWQLKAERASLEGASSQEVFDMYEQALSRLEEPGLRADLLVDIGVYERELGRDQKDRRRRYIERALVRFREAVRLVPGHRSARLNLAQFSARYGTPESTHDWLEGIDLRGASRYENAVAHSLYAQVAISEEKWGDAHRHFELARALQPDLAGLDTIKNTLDQYPLTADKP